MRFPWQRRADVAQTEHEHAEGRLERAEADWPQVHAVVERVRRERELNGWTSAIVTIFEGD